jgi:hypothetical protein
MVRSFFFSRKSTQSFTAPGVTCVMLICFWLKLQRLIAEIMFESYLLSVAVLSLIGVEGNRAGFTGRQLCGTI